MQPSAIKHLLDRGDRLAIENGRLAITPASGKTVPADWLKANERQLATAILRECGLDALSYIGYSAGNFGRHRAGGVQLQFESLLAGKSAYCVFNAWTKYAKGRKEGKPLPKGRFRAGKCSDFVKFWHRAGFKLPNDRLSSFHDYMGKLGALIFVARYQEGEKIEKQTLQPLSLSCEQIKAAFDTPLPDKGHTASVQAPDNFHTKVPYKEGEQSQIPQGLGQNQTAGKNSCGKRLLGSAVTQGNVIPISSSPKSPQDQSIDEWLADYRED